MPLVRNWKSILQFHWRLSLHDPSHPFESAKPVLAYSPNALVPFDDRGQGASNTLGVVLEKCRAAQKATVQCEKRKENVKTYIWPLSYR